MRYTVVKKSVVEDWLMNKMLSDSYVDTDNIVKVMLDGLRDANMSVVFNGKVEDAKNYISHKSIETGDAYYVYRYYKPYGLFKYAKGINKLVRLANYYNGGSIYG